MFPKFNLLLMKTFILYETMFYTYEALGTDSCHYNHYVDAGGMLIAQFK